MSTLVASTLSKEYGEQLPTEPIAQIVSAIANNRFAPAADKYPPINTGKAGIIAHQHA